MCLIGPRKLFEVLIRESLCDNVQKAGDLPIVTDVGEVIAGSGYAGWFVRKGFRELSVRSDPATHAKSTQLLRRTVKPALMCLIGHRLPHLKKGRQRKSCCCPESIFQIFLAMKYARLPSS